jgi:hypothetical protein
MRDKFLQIVTMGRDDHDSFCDDDFMSLVKQPKRKSMLLFFSLRVCSS